MSKQNQSTETKLEKKSQPKTESTAVAEPAQEFDSLTEITNELPALAGSDPVKNQMAARLSDQRIPAAQRRALAGHISNMQGNGHLQRLVTSAKTGSKPAQNGHGPNGTTAPRTRQNGAGRQPTLARKLDTTEITPQPLGDESFGGGNGAPMMALSEPPPPANNTNGNGHHDSVQREEAATDKLPTEAEKAAALAKAAAAKQTAGQTKNQGQREIAKSKNEKVAEQQAGEVAKQKASQSKSEAAAQGDGKGADAGATPAAAVSKNGKGEAKPASSAGAGPNGAAVKPAPDSYDKAPASSEEDPAFQSVVKNIKAASKQQQTHAPAKTKSAEAQAAAESPAAEIASKAQANQVGEMEGAETPGFDAAGFKAQLMERIAALAPKTPKEADDFKDNDKLSGVKDESKAKAAEEQAATKAPLAEKTEKAPDTSGVEPKPVTPLAPAQPGAPPPNLGAEAAAPKAKTPSEVESPLKQNSKALNQEMAQADVTEDQLEKSNEPEFEGAVAAKKEAQTDAATAPQGARQFEADQLTSAENEATAMAQEKTGAMHGDRAAILEQVQGEQGETKSKDEQERQKVAAEIQKIYDETKGNVERILQALDGKVEKAFDEGATAAKQAFEDYVDKQMDAYKEERYGGWLGWARWLDDQWSGLPSEVNVFYQDGRQLFINKMDAVIDNVVSIIGRGLAEAKAEIANGKKRIQTYIAGLEPSLRQVGQQAAQEMDGKFKELEESVDNKQGELIDTLANKYQEKLKAVDARIEEMKEANKGLKDKAIDAIVGVIKTILELKDMLLNVLSRAAAAIGKIIKDPIGFLGNLIDGIKLGFNNFVSNIGTHLKKGLISWLTGSIAGAGIILPETFDLKGIFQLVMQILGLSFDQIMKRVADLLGFDIRAFIAPIMEIIDLYKAEGMVGLAKRGLAKLIGQERVEALMKVWEIIQVVMSGNFGQLWEMAQGYLSGLKDMVLGKIEEFIGERVIKAGITWVLSLFNPAGAFIKACKMIYDVVMFFVENGRQIMALVNAVIDSITNIASGNITAAAKYIEETLAKAIPVAISFLARLLGLGNVSEKVQEIIQSVRGMVEKALDAIFNSGPVKMVAGFIKKVVGKVKGLAKAGIEKVKGWGKAGVEKVKGWGKAGVEKVKGKFGIGKEKEEPQTDQSSKMPKDQQIGAPQEFESGTEAHRLWVDERGGRPVIMVASTATELQSLLNSPRVEKLAARDPNLATNLGQAKGILTRANIQIEAIVQAARSGDQVKIESADENLEKQMQDLAAALKKVMAKIEESRKPATINKLFEETNQEQPVGAPDRYSEKLRDKLNSFGAGILLYEQSGRGGAQVIKRIRGEDKKWRVEQGAIYASFVSEQSEAIKNLAGEAKDTHYLLSLERGGTLVREQVTQHVDVPHHDIAKRQVSEREAEEMVKQGLISQEQATKLVEKGEDAYKIQQQADLQTKIHEIMGSIPKDEGVTIAIAETKVGGGSANQLIKTLKKIVKSGIYPNLRFKVLLLSQTMHKKDTEEAEELGGLVYQPVVDARKIQVVIASVRYLLGEDVDYQAAPDSSKPIIVFQGTEENLIAYKITPTGETSARDVLGDLVDGAYNGFLPGVL
ncbi:MAG: hypothetical protein H6631_04065 [Anaerolineaceae bacterium]|nr:hypothetical protein [Anaerolineaceae bacterium]